LHGGDDASRARSTRAWLTLIEAAARPLARRHVSPDALTGAGVLLAAAAPLAACGGGRWRLAAAGAVAASGLADGLDGAVAVLSGVESDWGFVLDSLADRASDAFVLLALRAAGAPAPLGAAAGAGIVALEYARARAAAAGFSEIGIVTVGERPVRIAVAASTLAVTGIFPYATRVIAAAGALAVAGLSVVGAAQFVGVAADRLHASDRSPDSSGRPDQARD
jgi:CDP-diacylglycerol--glycerol-3-phosphate 3-phosphatidyltransferase